MHSLYRFRICGISKLTRAEVQIEFDAITEVEARGNAALQDIAVTSVERLSRPLRSDAGPSRVLSVSSVVAPTQGVHDSPMPAQAGTSAATLTESKGSASDPPRRWRSRIPAAFGWFVFVAALLAAFNQWMDATHRYHSGLELLLDARDSEAAFIGLRAIVASNMYGVAAIVVGLAIFFFGSRTTGKRLVLLAIVTIAINLAGQFRAKSQREAVVEHGMPLTPTQGKR